MIDFTDPWDYPLFHMSVEEQMEMQRHNEELKRQRQDNGTDDRKRHAK